MNKKILTIIVLTLSLMACVNQLNKQDLTLWNSVGEARWTTLDGVTQSSSAANINYLVSPSKFKNFILDLEFYPTAEVNSGVFVACQNPIAPDASSCHEINIWDNHPKQEFRTGAIVGKAYPPAVHLSTLDKWNSYSITVLNGKVIAVLNGEETARLENGNLGAGYLALQKAENGLIKFRNIVVRPLP